MGIRDTRTTHPRKSARRERALDRLVDSTKYKAHGDKAADMRHVELITLELRIGKPPRSWPMRRIVVDA